jgi:hypothetical protein
MTTAFPSIDIVVPVEPLLTEPEGSPWPVPRRLQRVDPATPTPSICGCPPRGVNNARCTCSGTPRRHRRLRPRQGNQEPGTCNDCASALHRLPLLPLRGRGRTARALSRRARPRPRLDYESHAIGLDRNEVGSLFVAAGLGASNEHALIWLFPINGLGSRKHSARTSTPSVWNAGIAPSLSCVRAARSSLFHSRRARPERSTSANDSTDRSSCGRRGRGWTALRHRILRRVARRAGVDKPIGPHAL